MPNRMRADAAITAVQHHLRGRERPELPGDGRAGSQKDRRMAARQKDAPRDHSETGSTPTSRRPRQGDRDAELPAGEQHFHSRSPEWAGPAAWSSLLDRLLDPGP